MKLKLTESLSVAHEVLSKVSVPKEVVDRVSVCGYENGRESGLCANVFMPQLVRFTTICWSQYRNIDSIVVYVSEPGEYFDRNSNVPTERAHKEAKFFAYDQSEEAAKYISDVLKATGPLVG